MFEKVNPQHPDKVADRIAGAMVDIAYSKNPNAKMACEVLIGHGLCTIITETSEHITLKEAQDIVQRLVGDIRVIYSENQQDQYLAGNLINNSISDETIADNIRELTETVKY